MLRVGLTGGLGSGKSTVARMLAERGAQVLESDAIGRELMQPGERVYRAIVERFGPGVVLADGGLNRPALARLAFAQGRAEELNGIVHPAVIARQERLIEEIAARDQRAIVVVESALIFETKYGDGETKYGGGETKYGGGETKYGGGETKHGGAEGWRTRFDRMVLVTAPEEVKIARFLGRSRATEETRAALEAEARRRLAAQMPDAEKVAFCDYVISNTTDYASLHAQVEDLWNELQEAGSIER